MTVTPSTSDVADKAVSTDDGSGMEVARLEAVLAALVETKVEAIKASSTLNKRSGSAPASPRRLRLTSTSTASSSLNHHHHHHHHHHQHRRKSHHYHHHHHHHHRKRHDSAPCDEFIEDEHYQHNSHRGKARRRASESPRRPRKKRKHSKSPNILHGVVQDVQLNSRFELIGMDGDQDLALINFERIGDTFSDSCEYPQLHQSACYFSQSTAQLKIHYDNDENYMALNVADELEEEEILSGIEKIEKAREKYHQPRKKRKRKRHKIKTTIPREEFVDPEELPPRARWTIVATACLLLAMSLLLVGVTLRMAPIIDDMGNGRRNNSTRITKSRRASIALKKDSVRPVKCEVNGERKIVEDVQDLEQARRHRRITMIILGTFLFLLAASVLAVVVTLTQSTFLTPAAGSKELAEHRAP